MYIVRKTIGAYSYDCHLENTEKHTQIKLGASLATIQEILTGQGYTDLPAYRDEWNIEVNKETADILATSMMKIKKPFRDQRKVTLEAKARA